MKIQRLLVPSTRILGFIAVAVGCVFGGLLAAPTKPMGSAGLYRESLMGESYLVYGHTSGPGANFYSTPLPAVLGAAVLSSVIGVSLLWLSRRFSRSLTP
jgi:hypothetical protein